MQVFSNLEQLPSLTNTVLTIGSFDGVHVGHQHILAQVRRLAKKHGGPSVVLTFEPHPRTVLQPEDTSFSLITSTSEKIRLFEKAGLDYAILAPFTPEFARYTAQQYVEDFLLRYLRPAVIVIGYDHHFGAQREGDIHFLRRYEAQGFFRVVEIPAQLIEEITVSSTKIRRAIEAGNIAQANRFLGHPFAFRGVVVPGQQVGRTLGFPTANLELEEPRQLIPPDGIYAARAYLPDETGYDAMLYIGHRPTLSGNRARTIEAHLLDFKGNLYGQILRIEVIDFVRKDQKLAHLEELRTHIEADRQVIRERLSQAQQEHPVESNIVCGHDEVVIVVLNYNTRAHLETYLPSVLAHSEGARIIVADNGSPDDSVAMLHAQFPEVELIELKHNYGFAQGYNEALARIVGGNIIVILNSDVEVTPGWMVPVLEAMQANARIAVVQPKILSWRQKNRFEYAGAAGGWIDALGYPFCRGRIFSCCEEDSGQYDAPQECFWAAGAALFIRADLFRRIGGFDGTYFAHNEEIDLCWRLKRAGYAVWCIPQSVVYHLGGGTLEYENPRKIFLNFRNSLFTLLKNESVGKLLWLIPTRLVLDGIAGIRFLIYGQWQAAVAIVQAHFSFYRNFVKILRKRRIFNELVEKVRIGPPNRTGIYKGSIVYAHYIRGIRKFASLKSIFEGN
ncbi:MAG: bifunctional riboflavin kinase/FAD synthetase [Saprospiraceae bacterium]|nr:bifunctional riboflavin kinase/FAD synthetase [Saprospiraceae bacterium]MDW8482894.1 bifunctional riboflavin kinase/FAD synthetase [Saprospiraceae bacterium]